MLPRHSALSELSLIDPTLPSPSAPPDHQDLPCITPHLQDDTTSVIIGAGLPPVPGRLVKRIREGHFIEMGELLPECLGMAAVNFEVEGSKNPKGKCKPVTNILEWLQCFGLYVAILSQSEPERIPDLQGYQVLIIQASMEYDDNRWMGYDRVFRLKATSQKGISWSSIDTTLWNVAFSGKSKTGRCSQCFSLTHSSAECRWSSETHSSKTTTGSVSQSTKMFRPVCYEWNATPSPNCSYPHCKYEHKCAICVRNPWVQEVHHKAIHCPHRSDHPLSQPLPRIFQANQKGHSSYR